MPPLAGGQLPADDVPFLAIELDAFRSGRFDPPVSADHFVDSGHLFTDSQDIGSPGMTKAVVNASNLVKNNFLYIVVTIVLFVVSFKKFVATPKGRELYDDVLLRLPVFGLLLRSDF